MKPKLLLSLPSSGTDWLATVIASMRGVSYYHKEFFNPITNNDHYWLLAPYFGCEALSCASNIAKKAPPEIIEVVVKRFMNLGYNFNKENFLFWNVPGLVEHFDIFFLKKKAENTFPPSRVRVYSWYDAIGGSIEKNIGHKFTTNSLHDRAAQVHDYCWDNVAAPNARLYGLPVLSCETLMVAPYDEVLEELHKAFSAEQSEALASAVLETRKTVAPRNTVVPE